MRDEKKKWIALRKPPDEIAPLYSEREAKTSSGGLLPDESLLDADEAEMLQSLTNDAMSSAGFRSQVRSRVRALQAALGFKVDQLATGVHALDQRGATATREADRVLGLSAARLKEREDKEKAAAGTRDLPAMEVLRSLGRLLPPDGRGEGRGC